MKVVIEPNTTPGNVVRKTIFTIRLRFGPTTRNRPHPPSPLSNRTFFAPIGGLEFRFQFVSTGPPKLVSLYRVATPPFHLAAYLVMAVDPPIPVARSVNLPFNDTGRCIDGWLKTARCLQTASEALGSSVKTVLLTPSSPPPRRDRLTRPPSVKRVIDMFHVEHPTPLWVFTVYFGVPVPSFAVLAGAERWSHEDRPFRFGSFVWPRSFGCLAYLLNVEIASQKGSLSLEALCSTWNTPRYQTSRW